MKLQITADILSNGITAISLTHNCDLNNVKEKRRLTVMVGYGEGIRDDGICMLNLGDYDEVNNRLLFDTSLDAHSETPSIITLGVEHTQGKPLSLHSVPFNPNASSYDFEVELPD